MTKCLGQLSEMESMVDQELPGSGVRQMNIWPGKPFYSFPEPRKDIAWIDLHSSITEPCNLKFTITIYP